MRGYMRARQPGRRNRGRLRLELAPHDLTIALRDLILHAWGSTRLDPICLPPRYLASKLLYLWTHRPIPSARPGPPAFSTPHF